jgi:anti-sigma regulatory factor (Ser/Thr protein kinase)
MRGTGNGTRRARQERDSVGGLINASARGGDGPVPRELDFTIDDLGRVRALVSAAAAMTPLDGERSADLVLAVNELVTNSICHGGGHGTLRVWCADRSLLCEVSDEGHIPAPAAELGRDRPDPDALSGRGLWLVDQLCDAVQISSSQKSGSSVRVEMRLP